MLEFRPISDTDIPQIECWLNKPHVKRWYEIPGMGITIEDWMSEIKAYKGEFHWITYLMVLQEGQPIGFCLYYKCLDSDEEFGSCPMTGAYGIDYLIGEEAFLGKKLGKEMVTLLTEKIFSFPDAQLVTADIDKENRASEKTLLSCGFTLLENGRSRYIKWKNNGI